MRTVPLIAVLMLALTTPAYAYLDPGTGSMILQMALAGAIAAAASIKIFWHSFKAAIGRLLVSKRHG
jgi:hypothetical protein